MFSIDARIKRDFLETCSRIRDGSLRLKTPEGETHDFGSGEPHAEMEIHDWSVVVACLTRGDIGLGETYVEGLWDTPSIANVTEVALRNIDEFQGYAHAGFFNRLKFRVLNSLLRANSTRGASRNIRAHYDVGNEFYKLWLDSGMTYSSAIFDGDASDLHDGQNRKIDRILNRLGDGDRVLEIGCGWGGFAERAAESGRHVTGLTISPSQHQFAQDRLQNRADIRLQDYRKSSGKFDNIVSIEMIEAVGEAYWPTYFGTLASRLNEGGRVLIQAITVKDSYFDIYRKGSDFIRHYTFPGGMLLSDSVIANQARQAGLAVRDSFAFGQDYSKTCAIWNQRIGEKRRQIQQLGYDDRFIRNWQFYLGICTASFKVGQTNVVQVELAQA